MTIKYRLVIVVMAILVGFTMANLSYAKGIMGPQQGDRSPEENDDWLKKGVEHINAAIEQSNHGDQEQSIKQGEQALAAMKEINSEGWAATLERTVGSVRRGIRAAKKGQLEKAATLYETALEKLGKPKFGDMNFTHESFMGIGDGR